MIALRGGTEEALFRTAAETHRRRFGDRIVLFTPLYVSNLCVNNCLYCGFRRDNAIKRRVLGAREISRETEAVSAMGHQTVLIVAGEQADHAGPRAIAQAIRTVRSCSAIRDVKVEVMPMEEAGYRRLLEAGAGGVVLYQETYDRPVYAQAHPFPDPKSDFDRRRTALDRAIRAGFKRVGIGILLGLADPFRDAAALVAHAREIRERFGFWPSTVSLPRLQPAPGAPWSIRPPKPVDDRTFLRLIAFLRTALPEVGIVLTTRESAALRGEILRRRLGITHLSAGSRTEVGGYASRAGSGQFSIRDERPARAVFEDLKRMGYAPAWAEEAATPRPPCPSGGRPRPLRQPDPVVPAEATR